MNTVITSGNITGPGKQLMAQIADENTVSVQLVASSLTGHNATFEVSNDGVNWVQVLGARTNSGSVCESTTGVLAGTPAYGWEFGVAAWSFFRVNAAAHTGGTAAYTIAGSDSAVEPCTSTASSVTASGTMTANQGTLAAPAPISINSLGTTNATSIKASAGTVYQLNASNSGAASAFLKLYNKASAPVVGTDVPVITIPIPAGGVASLNVGALGHRFATGIALAITNLMADADATVIAAGQVKVIGSYI